MRGMGRFTQQQVYQSLRMDPQIEIFLLIEKSLNPATCLYDWLNMERVHPVWLDNNFRVKSRDSRDEYERILQYSHRLQATLRQIGADVFHNSTPFLPPFYSALTRTPVVATCYDLIPLIFPSDYFTETSKRSDYYCMLRNLRASTRVAAISLSAKQDLGLYTGYPAGRIDITYPYVATVFRPGQVDEERRAEARAALRLGLPELPERFMLSVTGVHRSKNLGFLIESYARARRHRDWTGLPLVVVLPEKAAIDTFRLQFGEPEDVTLLVELSDEWLRDLYISADFVFQPSLYEGFGYPVAEAIQCGNAVVAMRAASMPEIAGESALLLAPSDRDAGAEAIRLLATDSAARDRLRELAQRQAANLSGPEQLGESTIACWRAAAGPTADRPRIALWSSMPPLDCGIADYTAELADALAETHEVDVYTDGSYVPSPRVAPSINFRHTQDFDPGEPGLVDRIFQLQARDYQAFMYPEILKYGGTITLHDITLASGFYHLARHFGRSAEFESMLAQEGPEAARDLGAVLARSGGAPDGASLNAVFRRHPMLRWAVGGHNKVLTHTDALARETLRYYPEAQVRVVPQGYGDRLPKMRHLPLAVWRQRLGVSPSGIVVGAFGIVGRNKRIEKVIAAFEQAWLANPDNLLVVAGKTYDAAYGAELAAQVAASSAAHRIVLADYTPPELFHTLIALSDVLVALRWPPLGGMSAVVMRGLAAGKPVIVSDIPDWHGAGGDACLRVPVENGEIDAIARHLQRLAADSTERGRLGCAARKWYRENATLTAMVADHLAGGRLPSSHPRPLN
jgi:glycosyltransferase involved in cell wall biosynthesis